MGKLTLDLYFPPNDSPKGTIYLYLYLLKSLSTLQDTINAKIFGVESKQNWPNNLKTQQTTGKPARPKANVGPSHNRFVSGRGVGGGGAPWNIAPNYREYSLCREAPLGDIQ
ncbi:hypothetical protein Y1Q_0006472 [Alligator mississippiensis]|uniref:Uncharacterized protein n=1 Tax=Alligator mississippiensis TaxID=8496 RepID=A0A151MVE8_ALLMI|nr:hypothetical protein Y1Q_0006472 [Alligator mississippiensis]